MNSFDEAVNRMLNEQEVELTNQEDSDYTAADLEAIVLRWGDRNKTSIKGSLLVKFLSFLEKVKEKIPVPIKGQLFPTTPNDTFSRTQGWIGGNKKKEETNPVGDADERF